MPVTPSPARLTPRTSDFVRVPPDPGARIRSRAWGIRTESGRMGA